MSESNIEDTTNSELAPSEHASKTVTSEELAASTHPKAPEHPLRVPPEEIIEEKAPLSEEASEEAPVEEEEEKPAKPTAKKK